MGDDLLPVKVEVKADATKALDKFYEDALAPGAVEAGDRGKELMQAVKIITKPLALAGNVVGWLTENPVKAVRFLGDAFSRIKGKLREPNPQFAGELLEGVKHAQPGTETWELFANLLASAADADLADAVQHPAFPQIVRTMATGEAQMFKLIGQGLVVGWGVGPSKGVVWPDPVGFSRTGGDPIHMEFEFGATYINRLEADKLIRLPRFTTKNVAWSRFAAAEDLPERPATLRANWKSMRYYATKPVEYTKFGKLFAQAVKLIPPESAEDPGEGGKK